MMSVEQTDDSTKSDKVWLQDMLICLGICLFLMFCTYEIGSLRGFEEGYRRGSAGLYTAFQRTGCK